MSFIDKFYKIGDFNERVVALQTATARFSRSKSTARRRFRANSPTLTAPAIYRRVLPPFGVCRSTNERFRFDAATRFATPIRKYGRSRKRRFREQRNSFPVNLFANSSSPTRPTASTCFARFVPAVSKRSRPTRRRSFGVKKRRVKIRTSFRRRRSSTKSFFGFKSKRPLVRATSSFYATEPVMKRKVTVDRTRFPIGAFWSRGNVEASTRLGNAPPKANFSF